MTLAYLFKIHILSVGTAPSCHQNGSQPLYRLFLAVLLLDVQCQAAVLLLLNASGCALGVDVEA